MYIHPGDLSEVNQVLRDLRWIVKECILKRDPNSNIIVMGDFNKPAIEKVKFLENVGLKKVLLPNQKTHIEGN